MNTTLLSVPFLDLLACKLPQLEKLFLWVADVVDLDQVRFLFFLVSPYQLG